jgi:RNA polymerase sigma-70 factor, ECF subfamily
VIGTQRFAMPDHPLSMETTDGALVTPGRLLKARQTYDLRFAELRGYLVGVCRSLVGDDAEDVVHDTYVVGRARFGQLRDPQALGSWLTVIAVNECYSRHRRRQRLGELIATLRPTVSWSSDPDLRAAVQALPFRARTVVVLHYGHGLSLDEIGRLLGTNPSTIRSVLFRAKKRLRMQLADPSSERTHVGDAS